MNRTRIAQIVPKVAGEAFNDHYYVSPIDVLLGIGMLKPEDIQNWRNRKIPYLEKVVTGNLNKISYVMLCFRKWAKQSKLTPSITVYTTKTRGGRKPLRFSKYGNPNVETSYRTHYINPLIAEKKKQMLKEQLPQSVETNATEIEQDIPMMIK